MGLFQYLEQKGRAEFVSRNYDGKRIFAPKSDYTILAWLDAFSKAKWYWMAEGVLRWFFSPWSMVKWVWQRSGSDAAHTDNSADVDVLHRGTAAFMGGLIAFLLLVLSSFGLRALWGLTGIAAFQSASSVTMCLFIVGMVFTSALGVRYLIVLHRFEQQRLARLREADEEAERLRY